MPGILYFSPHLTVKCFDMHIEHTAFQRTTYRYRSTRPWLILVLCAAASIMMSSASRLVSDTTEIVASPFDSEMVMPRLEDLPVLLGTIAPNCSFQIAMLVNCDMLADKRPARAEILVAEIEDTKAERNQQPLG